MSTEFISVIQNFYNECSPPPSLPHQGGGNLIFTPSPLMGEGWDGGDKSLL